jgi:hypothetical protein
VAGDCQQALRIPVMTAVDAYRECTETAAKNGAGQRRKLKGKSPTD